MSKNRFFLSALAWSMVLFSCIGTASQITINQDGSGSIKLEYRVASELEKWGGFDGNERWASVPMGRSDLERTVSRIPGLSLVSASSRQEGSDTIYSAKLDFAGSGALAAFFDASGRQCEADFAEKRLALFFPANKDSNAEFKELVQEAFQGYVFALSLSLPAAARISWLDEEGLETKNFPGKCSAGSAVEYSVPMADLLFLDTALTLEIRW